MLEIAVRRGAASGGGGEEQYARGCCVHAATSCARTHAMRRRRVPADAEHERPACATQVINASRALQRNTFHLITTR